MPHLQTILGALNTAFSKDSIPRLVAQREAFRPGQTLGAGIVVHPKTALHADWVEYLHRIPASIQETVRTVIYHALSTTPPTQITSTRCTTSLLTGPERTASNVLGAVRCSASRRLIYSASSPQRCCTHAR